MSDQILVKNIIHKININLLVQHKINQASIITDYTEYNAKVLILNEIMKSVGTVLKFQWSNVHSYLKF